MSRIFLFVALVEDKLEELVVADEFVDVRLEVVVEELIVDDELKSTVFFIPVDPPPQPVKIQVKHALINNCFRFMSVTRMYAIKYIRTKWLFGFTYRFEMVFGRSLII
ncbi:MAG: hypothetical protein EOP48_15295 [Sphingobacteriales bacterium]|nr:MAG: hypothetical protein EOP48_15295 [Sphingobacteriales bacterium]